MAKIELHVCDVTRKEPRSDDPLWGVVVHLPDKAVRLEVLRSVLRPVLDARLSVVALDLYPADEERLLGVIVDQGDFEAVADNMPEILAAASAINPNRRAPDATIGPRIDYTSRDHAGRPHRGKVTAAEARTVREHLAEVNARLAAEGHRPIEPSNPEHAQRYGFTVTPPARLAGQGGDGYGA